MSDKVHSVNSGHDCQMCAQMALDVAHIRALVASHASRIAELERIIALLTQSETEG